MVENLFLKNTISPYKELISYEFLWTAPKMSFKTMAQELSKTSMLPSQLVSMKHKDMFSTEPEQLPEIRKFIAKKNGTFSIMLKESPQYPQQLLDAKYPVDLFYYKGNLDIAREKKLVSVVGTRKISTEGMYRTKKLVKLLAENGYSIVSGLARGTDTIALHTAIEYNAKVVGVIGTPIDEYYPKENRQFQDFIAENHLLISQVPLYRYSTEHFKSKRIYFVERDATMAALSKATIIVEAGETSGTLVQARACLQQGRKVFILNSCFENPALSWPKRLEEKGAVRVRDFEDILRAFENNEQL